MIIATCLLPVMDALSKYLAADYPAFQIIWVRNAVHATILIPVVVMVRGVRSLNASHSTVQFLRGIAFGFANALWVVALSYMPMADAVAIIFLFPFLVTVGSSWFLGERVGVRRWLAVMTGMVGILLVVKPGFTTFGPGVYFALGAAILTAAYILFTRKLAGTAPASVMLALPAFIATVSLAPCVFGSGVFWQWRNPKLTDLGLMIVVGLLGATIHYLIILAYRHSEASAMVPLTYLQIVFSVALGFIIFGDLPDGLTATGIVIIITSGVFIALRTANVESVK